MLSREAIGASSYCRTYSSCLNPGIEVDGFGMLGVPLSGREATSLKQWEVRSSGRVTQGAEELESLEIDASKVRVPMVVSVLGN